MWVYEKRLQYPVNITQTNAKLAQVIISQFGGPDGELAASQRYLSQRYTMPDGMTKGLLNDIGTEELAHIEIVCAIIYQLTKNLSVEEIKASGFDKYVSLFALLSLVEFFIGYWQNGIAFLVLALLVSPIGLPAIANLLLNRLDHMIGFLEGLLC